MNSQKNKKSSKWVLIFIISSISILTLIYVLVSKEKVKVVPPKKDTKTFIYTDFNKNRFDFGDERALLAELGICDTTLVESELGACSPKYFRFFKLSDKKPLKDGFILLINGAAYSDPEAKFPIRRTMVFEREGKKLVSVNKFKGNIIETKEVQNSDYDDIVIRFRLDQYNEAYHVVYSWKNNRYQFSHCDELYSYFNKGKVRAEMVDSVSKEVEKIITEEKLVF